VNATRRQRASHSHPWCKWAVYALTCRRCGWNLAVVAPARDETVGGDGCSQCGCVDWEYGTT
jgi:hypothetical protein